MKACLPRQGFECGQTTRTHRKPSGRDGVGCARRGAPGVRAKCLYANAFRPGAPRVPVEEIEQKHRRTEPAEPLSVLVPEYRIGTVADRVVRASSSPSFGAIMGQCDSLRAGSPSFDRET